MPGGAPTTDWTLPNLVWASIILFMMVENPPYSDSKISKTVDKSGTSVARTQQYKDSKGKGHLRFKVCVCITD